MVPYIAPLNAWEQQPWFRSFHRWVVPRARVVTQLLQWYAALVLLLIIVAGFIVWQTPDNYYPTFDTIGRILGRTAAVLYSITLIPGMLRRFGLFPLVRSILMIWRRYFGIAMFHTAFVHQMLIRTFPLLTVDPSLLLQNPGMQPLYGMAAFALLFPLWLTSNDWSVKRMGKLWHFVHAFTYIALFFIYLHVMLATSGWIRGFLGLILTLEVLSWLARWIWPPAPAVAPAPPDAPRVQ